MRKPETTPALPALIKRLADLSEQRKVLEQQIRRCQLKLLDIAQQHIETENQISTASLLEDGLALPTKSAPSKRNMSALRAWAALHALLRDPQFEAGLPLSGARDAIRRSAQGMPEATIRSHIFRLKKDGFILVKGNVLQPGPNAFVSRTRRKRPEPS